ncbi:MAG: hypothetical protein LWX56_06615, partial [Ignavibacteria bacterium]|nr:hypothetical protein [Ignavibacteria bacterium]
MKYFIMCGIALSVAGCFPDSYMPTNPSINLTQKPGQVWGTGYGGRTGFHGNVGVSLPHGLQLGASVTSLDREEDSFHAREFMFGYYDSLDVFIVELYGGVGTGEVNSYEMNDKPYSSDKTKNRTKGDFTKYFGQVTLGGKGKHGYYGVYMRASSITYNSLKLSIEDGNSLTEVYNARTYGMLWEPGFFCGIGNENITFGM